MIQRVQTILLALIVVFSIVLFFVPIYTFQNELGLISVGAYWIKIAIAHESIRLQYHYLIAILVVAVILNNVFSVLSYKNRLLQLKLCLLNTVLLLGVLGAMVYVKGTIPVALLKVIAVEKYGFGFFVPVICLLLNMISIRFIKRDEKIVKDAFERLR